MIRAYLFLFIKFSSLFGPDSDSYAPALSSPKTSTPRKRNRFEPVTFGSPLKRQASQSQFKFIAKTPTSGSLDSNVFYTSPSSSLISWQRSDSLIYWHLLREKLHVFQSQLERKHYKAVLNCLYALDPYDQTKLNLFFDQVNELVNPAERSGIIGPLGWRLPEWMQQYRFFNASHICQAAIAKYIPDQPVERERELKAEQLIPILLHPDFLIKPDTIVVSNRKGRSICGTIRKVFLPTSFSFEFIPATEVPSTDDDILPKNILKALVVACCQPGSGICENLQLKSESYYLEKKQEICSKYINRFGQAHLLLYEHIADLCLKIELTNFQPCMKRIKRVEKLLGRIEILENLEEDFKVFGHTRLRYVLDEIICLLSEAWGLPNNMKEIIDHSYILFDCLMNKTEYQLWQKLEALIAVLADHYQSQTNLNIDEVKGYINQYKDVINSLLNVLGAIKKFLPEITVESSVSTVESAGSMDCS